MRPLELGEKVILYRVTKSALAIAGSFLVILGSYYLSILAIGDHSPEYWIGLLPAYMGVMLILISLAMRIEWFTDTRRFW